jgi:dihydroceramidase
MAGGKYNNSRYAFRAESAFRHLMTGVGAYCYLVWGTWLRHCLNGRQDEYELVWPRLFCVPHIIRSSHCRATLENDSGKKFR